MNNQEEPLRMFLAEKSISRGIATNDNLVKHFSEALTFEKGIPPERGKTRKVTILDDTNGNLSAESVSLYNLLKVSFYDLGDLLFKEALLLLSKDERIIISLSLLNLIYEFYPKITHTFNEQDACILLSIFYLNKKSFTFTELERLPEHQCHLSISDELFKRSLDYFVEMKILKLESDERYTLRQEVVYHRK
jgi:hypothetical protein